MKVKKGTNRVVLLKFLLAKLRYSIEGLSIEEFLLLNHLFFDLTESKDPLFQKKYSCFFRKLEILISMMSKIRIFPIHLSERGKENLDEHFNDIIPTSREYFGLAGQRDLRNSFRLVLNDTLIPRAVPPKRFIGVGYKDKGSRRDPAFDGTPSWQETAQYLSNLEREAEELDSSFSESPELDE
jgi:hypothetical protein